MNASSWPRPTLTLSLVLVVLVGVSYGVLFPDRTDYLGHFLAGAGGTFWLLAIVVELDRNSRWPVVYGVLAAVLLGVFTEATVFRLAEFDPVDLANQSLGAVFAGFGMVDGRPYDRSAGIAGVAGLALLVAGFAYAFS
ncbi:hypothetical protein EFK50_12905 [Nocardioides marmoriginsengisoli]|uniref:VanZ family protein n=1 Tax=Nocardioides marmoriginsengisoli TaxID=661483 RepID=A0A3N0CGR9_9ACTN|nr:hypothetical protein [Nocardioides marmoriginsengisoli]RNL62650.1 hypothetical protein EFK50_12905 [Nocardioides marmoriginsengisoli]